MKKRAGLLVGFITCLLFPRAFSQEIAVDSIVLSGYGISGVSDLRTDHNGLLYLNDPDGGLFRFTGNGFDPIMCRQDGVLKEVKYLRQFIRGYNGAFYALNLDNRVLSFFENGNIHPVEGIDSLSFKKIIDDRFNRIWFFGDRTWVIQGDSLREVPQFSLAGLDVSVFRQSDSTLTAVCGESLMLFDLLRENVLPVPLREEIRAYCGDFIRISQDSVLFLSSFYSGSKPVANLFNVRNGNFEQVITDEDLTWGTVFPGSHDRTFLISTTEGLFEAEMDDYVQTVLITNLLPRVQHLLLDRFNTIWASNGSALYKLTKRRFSSALIPEPVFQLPWYFSTNALIDHHGDIWTAGKNGEINFFDPFTGEKMGSRFPESFPFKSRKFQGKNTYVVNFPLKSSGDTLIWFEEPPAIRVLALGKAGQMYAGGWKTLYYFNPGDEYFVELISFGAGENLTHILPLNTDTLIVYTNKRILMLDRYDDIVWESDDFGKYFEDSLSVKMKNDNEVIAEVISGKLLYIRLLNCVLKTDISNGHTEMVYYNNSRKIDGNYYKGNICERGSGEIWFCFADTLYTFSNGNKIKKIGLPAVSEGKPAVYEEVLYTADKIWINTNRNLMTVDPRNDSVRVIHNDQLTDVYKLIDGTGNFLWRINTRTVQLINKQVGTLISFPVRSGVNHREIIVSRIGRYIVATNGSEVIRFDEMSFSGQIHTEAFITKLSVNQDPLCLEENIIEDSLLVLNYNADRVSFKLATGDPGRASSASFMYRLVNFDDEWMVTGRSGEISYTSLPAGNYILEFATQDREGKWGEVSRVYLTIPPPWWETKIAFGGYLVALITIIALYIRFRERKLKEDKKRLEKAVRERTAEIEQQKEEIESQRDLITVQQKNLTSSISYASRIQKALIPGQDVFYSIIPDHFIVYKPRDIVSGDFYWVEEKDDHIVIVGADCTGHGVPGSLLSMLGITFLEDIVNTERELSPARILDRLRDRMVNALKQSGRTSEMKDGMDIVVVSVNRKDRRLRFAGAKNPIYFIRDNQLREIKGDSFSIGYSENMVPFREQLIELMNGDMVYLFSDGFADQFGGEEGKKFKYSRFREMILTLSSLPLEEQKNSIENKFSEWIGDIEQIDDVMVMGFRF